MLPVCSTTLKRDERPSVRPLSTGLSRVVVERAQAEPPGLCCSDHRLRSREEEEAASRREVEPEETRRCSLGEPYLGEQQGLSMRPWTLSREVEMWRDRAEAKGLAVEAVGRGDQSFVWSPLLEGRESVCSPTLTLRRDV